MALYKAGAISGLFSNRVGPFFAHFSLQHYFHNDINLQICQHTETRLRRTRGDTLLRTVMEEDSMEIKEEEDQVRRCWIGEVTDGCDRACFEKKFITANFGRKILNDLFRILPENFSFYHFISKKF